MYIYAVCFHAQLTVSLCLQTLTVDGQQSLSSEGVTLSMCFQHWIKFMCVILIVVVIIGTFLWFNQVNCYKVIFGETSLGCFLPVDQLRTWPTETKHDYPKKKIYLALRWNQSQRCEIFWSSSENWKFFPPCPQPWLWMTAVYNTMCIGGHSHASCPLFPLIIPWIRYLSKLEAALPHHQNWVRKEGFDSTFDADGWVFFRSVRCSSSPKS